MDASAALASLSGSPSTETNPSMAFRSPWFTQQALSMQVEYSRLAALAESLKQQEAALTRKLQELSEADGATHSIISQQDANAEIQRQHTRASLQQQVAHARTELGNVLNAAATMQQMFSQYVHNEYFCDFHLVSPYFSREESARDLRFGSFALSRPDCGLPVQFCWILASGSMNPISLTKFVSLPHLSIFKQLLDHFLRTLCFRVSPRPNGREAHRRFHLVPQLFGRADCALKFSYAAYRYILAHFIYSYFWRHFVCVHFFLRSGHLRSLFRLGVPFLERATFVRELGAAALVASAPPHI
jgi:hypothetical protein